jgi:hypothetical protein
MKLCQLEEKSAANCLQLRWDDRQHWGVNTVEFIEASPGTALTKAAEYLVDCLEVHTIAAVRDHAEQTELFG